jgi:hypothetical protein
MDNFKENFKKFQERVKQRDIKALVHFTPVSNLIIILEPEYRFSISQLETQNVEFSINDGQKPNSYNPKPTFDLLTTKSGNIEPKSKEITLKIKTTN